MEKAIAPKKLDFLIADQEIKVRIYLEHGQPVADFSGLNLHNRRLTVEAIEKLQDMLQDVYLDMHFMGKAAADGSK